MALFEDDTVEVRPRSELCWDDVNVDLDFTQLFSLTAAMDSYFHGVKYFGRFDLVLAHKMSMVNLAANPATFVHIFSVGFIFGFMSKILV